MNIVVDVTDKKWLREGVITALVKNHGYKQSAAKQAFNNSPLLNMLQENAEYVFHYDTDYWANWLVEMQKKMDAQILVLNGKST